MAMRQGERMKLCIEQEREEEEKRRSGMPGAIKWCGTWTRKRQDRGDATFAKAKSPSLD